MYLKIQNFLNLKTRYFVFEFKVVKNVKFVLKNMLNRLSKYF